MDFKKSIRQISEFQSDGFYNSNPTDFKVPTRWILKTQSDRFPGIKFAVLFRKSRHDLSSEYKRDDANAAVATGCERENAEIPGILERLHHPDFTPSNSKGGDGISVRGILCVSGLPEPAGFPL